MSQTAPGPDSASSIDKGGPPFVGREQELGLLERWFEEATAGHPRVVLVEGEAGIGKTRLLHEAMTIARRLGMDVSLGRCYEDLALPYLPFHEILLPRLEQLPDDASVSLGIDRQTIGQLLHRVGTVSPEARHVLAGQADHEKLQLFLAVGHATVKFAQRRPMLFVVEDLHWADRMSLDLFDHVAFTASDTAAREPVPIVIIGTYRPLAPEERLGRLVARLQREDVCRSLSLAGLTEGEIHQLIGGLGVPSPSHQLTATVNDATHGNPLFIQEVMHHLQAQDALQEQGGFVVATAAASDLHLPDQVTAAIVARAEALSEPCRRAFTLAAFLGDGFSLPTLSKVSGVGEDELLNLLEEGMRQRLLRSDGPTFQFAHPLIRHVFYHQPSAPRRLRYHKQIADSLQAMHAASLDKHVLEIAHHLVKAGSVADQDVVVSFARRAADQAFGVFAWSEAAYYYEAALAAAESTGNLEGSDRANLHFRAGLAHYYDQDIGPCLHHYQNAIDTYRQAGDVPGLGHALMEKTRTQFTLASVPFGSVADLKPLEDVILALGEQQPALRGHILAVIAEAYRNGRQAEKARERGQQALHIGRQLQDNMLCAYASFALALAHISDLHVVEALDGWQNALMHARQAADVIREGWALHRLPLALSLLGRLGETEDVSNKACDKTRLSQDWSNHSLGLSHLASVAVARGDFAAAERRAHETMLMVSRSRYPWGGFRALGALACARALRGAWSEVEDALDAMLEPGRLFEDAGRVVQTFGRVFRQLARAHAGSTVEPLEPLARDVMQAVGTDTYSLAPLCALAELADLAGKATVAELPYPALSRAAERGVLFSSGWMFLVPRVLGCIDTLNGRWAEAEARFQTAVEVGSRQGARPELGRTYLDLARLKLARNDRVEASRLVAEASEIFAELGMRPLFARAPPRPQTLDTRLAQATPRRAAYPDGLDEREVEVLNRMAQGHSRQKIAGDLVLGQETVAGHVSSILSKIRVADEAAAMTYAVEQGLASPALGSRSVGRPVRESEGPARPLRIILVSDVVALANLHQPAGDARAHDVIRTHNMLIRQCLAAYQGAEIVHTGDGVEASFTSSSSAVECAVVM